MPFWQRSLILLVAMMAISFLVGLLWSSFLGLTYPLTYPVWLAGSRPSHCGIF